MEELIVQTLNSLVDVQRVNFVAYWNQVEQVGSAGCDQIAQLDGLRGLLSEERVILECKIIGHLCPRSKRKGCSIAVHPMILSSTRIVKRLVENVHLRSNCKSESFRPMVDTHRQLVSIVAIARCKAVVIIKHILIAYRQRAEYAFVFQTVEQIAAGVLVLCLVCKIIFRLDIVVLIKVEAISQMRIQHISLVWLSVVFVLPVCRLWHITVIDGIVPEIVRFLLDILSSETIA